MMKKSFGIVHRGPLGMSPRTTSCKLLFQLNMKEAYELNNYSTDLDEQQLRILAEAKRKRSIDYNRQFGNTYIISQVRDVFLTEVINPRDYLLYKIKWPKTDYNKYM